MRVLVDTNVLISVALSSKSVPFQAYVKAVSTPNHGLICEQNVDEMKRSFAPKKQNAPGFAFFGSIRVRFLVFHTFGHAKFSGHFLFTLSHSVYRLKSLVIPLSRDVSFLT